jgi:hypothetical protein
VEWVLCVNGVKYNIVPNVLVVMFEGRLLNNAVEALKL